MLSSRDVVVVVMIDGPRSNRFDSDLYPVFLSLDTGERHLYGLQDLTYNCFALSYIVSMFFFFFPSTLQVELTELQI